MSVIKYIPLGITLTAISMYAFAQKDALEQELAVVQEKVVSQETLSQENVEEDIVVLEKIMVEGQLIEGNVQELATSAVILDSETLERSADTDLYDQLENVPNVNQVFGNKGFAIRGVTQFGIGSGSNDGTNGLINVSLDGAVVPSINAGIYGPYSSWDMGQIEVLRGAQSTQQGRNALAGSIYIKSAEVDLNKQIRKARLKFGDNGDIGTAVAINEPLIKNKLGIRLSAEQSKKDGYVDNVTRNDDEYNEQELENYRAKIFWRASDKLDIGLSHNQVKNTAGSDLILDERFPGKRESESDAKAKQGSDHQITVLDANYYIDDKSWIESKTSYYKHDFDRQEDTDYTAFPGNTFLMNTKDDSLTQEIKWMYDNSDDLQAVAGLFYTRINNDYNQNVTVPASSVIGLPELPTIQLPLSGTGFDLNLISDPLLQYLIAINNQQTLVRKTDNMAAFFEANYKLNDRLKATAGLRYDREEIDLADKVNVDIYARPLPFFKYPYVPEESGKSDTKFSAWLPKVGLSYELSDNKTIGFSAQRAYRAGGVQRNSITAKVNEYDPEYTNNYELFYRSQSSEGKYLLNANVFYTDWKDMQVPIFGSSGNQFDFDTVNAGEAKLYGFELDGQAALNEKARVSVGAGYTKTKFTDFDNNGVNYNGNQFPFAPRFSLKAGIDYQLTPEISMSLVANHKARQFNQVYNNKDEELDSYTTADAQVSYTKNNWSFALNAKNITDEDYKTQLFNDRTKVLARAGDPRYIGLSINYLFEK